MPGCTPAPPGPQGAPAPLRTPCGPCFRPLFPERAFELRCAWPPLALCSFLELNGAPARGGPAARFLYRLTGVCWFALGASGPAAMSVHVQVFVGTRVFIALGSVPRSWNGQVAW